MIQHINTKYSLQLKKIISFFYIVLIVLVKTVTLFLISVLSDYNRWCPTLSLILQLSLQMANASFELLTTVHEWSLTKDVNSSLLTSLLNSNSSEDGNSNISADVLLEETSLEYQVGRWILLIYRPLCVLLGMTGNILSIVVIMTTSLRHSPSAIYMVTLALLDWVLSFFAGLTILPKESLVGEERFFTASWHCRVYYFILLFVAHFATLTLVAMTTQRYVAVRFPLQSVRWNTMRGATLTLIAAGTVAFLANVMHLLTLHLHPFNGQYRGRCGANTEVSIYLQMRVYPWIDSVIYFLFPTVTIAIFNVLIYRAMRESRLFKWQAVKRQKLSPSLQNDISLAPPVARQQNPHAGDFRFKNVTAETVGQVEISSPRRQTVSSESCATSLPDGGGFPEVNMLTNNYETCGDRVTNHFSGQRRDTLGETGTRLQETSASTAAVIQISTTATSKVSFAVQSKASITHAKPSTQLTKMLLCVSVAFLLLTLPLGVFIVVSRYWNPPSGYEKTLFGLFREITESLMFTNHVVNFLLYCMSGKRFRDKASAIICKPCVAQNRETTLSRQVFQSRETLPDNDTCGSKSENTCSFTNKM